MQPSESDGFRHAVQEFERTRRRLGVPPEQFLFVVNIERQAAALFEQCRVSPHPGPLSEERERSSSPLEKSPSLRTAPSLAAIPPLPPGEGRGEGEHCVQPEYQFQRAYRCSTSKFGIGQAAGSNCTPLGLHRIAEKIGESCPVGTIFKARKPVGQVPPGTLDATAITTRILWLEGLEPGFNRGGDVDTHARYIYLHGTGDETTLGRPASHGCIHLAAEDLIPLYDQLPVGTLVWISEE
ncbi:MAG: L,D-transpeptidase [Verrucomicrobia bacterium]|nr:L,D-transpeptidase [Verrucomicrobiota bacterium]